jgi:hypothetical protein
MAISDIDSISSLSNGHYSACIYIFKKVSLATMEQKNKSTLKKKTQCPESN